MRRHAKAPSAGSNLRQAKGLGRFALIPLVAALLLAAFPLSAQAEIKGKLAEICSPSGTPALGGLCNGPQGIAVNRTGAGGVTAGDFYVADRANHRIQEFTAAGTFVRAFGLNVIQTGKPGDVTPASSVQSLSVPNTVTGGIFRLSFNGQSTGGAGVANLTEGSKVLANLIVARGTANLTANSPTLTALSTSLGTFRVGQPVSGTGIPAGATVINVSGSTLTLSSNATATASGVAISSGGPRPFAVGQTITGTGIPAGTKIETVAAGTLTLTNAVEAGASGSEVAIKSGLAFNAKAKESEEATTLGKAGTIEGALKGLSTLGAASVSGGPGATNPYSITFGGSVANLPVPLLGADSSELTGGSIAASITTPGKSAYEICEVATDCQIGTNNVTPGGIQQVMSVAVDQATGNVYATGNISHRIDVFSATGAYEGSFGLGVRVGDSAPFGLDFCNASTGCVAGQTAAAAGLGAGAGAQANAPESRTMAVDSSGNLYLPDPGNRRLDVFAPILNGANEVTGANFVKAIGGDVIPSGAEGTGTVTSASNKITNVNTTKKAFRIGQTITGAGIPPNTTITALPAAISPALSTTIEISQNATATNAGTAISVAEGPGNVSQNEKQTITLPAGVTEGTFTLTFKVPKPSESSATTATIPFNATAEEVETKLGALANLGAPNLAVTGSAGGPWTVEFKGTRFADTNVEALAGNGSGLTPSGSIGVATTQEGTALETCTIASTCQIGGEGPAPGWFNQESPNSVAVDSSNDIYTLTYRGSGNCEANAPCRIQKFNPGGTVASSTFGPTSGGTNACQVNFSSGEANLEQALAVDVDPSTQHLFVLKKTAAAGARVCELGADGSFDGESISPEADLAVTSASQGPGLAVGLLGRVYAAQKAPGLYILGTVPSPGAKILPATNVTATGAELNGQVTVPSGTQGIPARYHFEVSADAGLHWIKIPAADVSVSAVAGTYEVHQVASGLQPNTNYLVRLLARTSQSVTSGQEVFTTSAIAPSVTESNGVGAVTSSSGKVFGTINPNNSPTTYRVEYGTTTSYGSQSPDFEPFLGSNGQPMNVSATLTGLQPDTAYHWRIVATNAAGTAKGEDMQLTSAEARQELNSCGLPDNRCYELVSPPDKGAAGVVTTLFASNGFRASLSGDSVIYPMLNSEGATTGGGLMYLAKRSETGWSSSQLNPPTLVQSPKTVYGGTFLNGSVPFASAELSCAVVVSFNPLTEDVPAIDRELDLVNLFRRSADGSFELITSPAPRNSEYKTGQVESSHVVYGGSPDCDRVYFSSPYEYLTSPTGLYEWEEGTLRDAGLLPDSTKPSSAPSVNAVSEDGAKLFFTAPSDEPATSGKPAIFMREDGTPPSIEVTKKQGGANASLGSRFGAASKDGSHAFFISSYGLTPISSPGAAVACNSFTAGEAKACDLYDYDTATGTLDDLSASAGGAAVQRILATSQEGKRVYFTAMGQLVPNKGKTLAENSAESTLANRTVNVYLSDEGSLSYVMTAGINALSATTTTPDGRYLLFSSSENVTGYASGGKSEAYLYSSATGEIQCTSCRQDGQAATADVGSPKLSEDGGQVFFVSRDALAPGAAQGNRNVYEWEHGQVYLLVAGQGKETSTGQEELYGVSPSGDDVFFGTIAKLDPHDVDTVTDLYDARVGGGFAPPPTPPIPCDPAADQCQGIPATAPGAPSPTSNAAGPGNPPVKKQQPGCRKGTVRRHGRCVRPRKHKRTSAHKRATHTDRGGVK